MDMTAKIAVGMLIFFVVIVLLRLFSTPLRLAVRVVANTSLGFGALLLLNWTAPVTGITLGVNVLNAFVVGILGIPGLGLLLLTQWLFT